MNSDGWGLGTMLLCLCMIGLCLFSCAVLVLKLERKTNEKFVINSPTKFATSIGSTIRNK